ncbi:caspase, EACC1-associated type [Floridanema evergladense]|uniref:SUMF1/EgtB/PvdO family nonheme iron enzyme n=1 Tax=Floridaenema evergladense BLCC-F167 TaxID=3153639 RepID=A0ABV4WIP3_9CYAN
MAKIALLIGVSEYEPGLNPLPAAVKDVEAMGRVLADAEKGDFTIQVLQNPQRQQMEEAIYRLFANRQKDDLLLFYFSGHGVKDESGNLFLATRTTRKDNGSLVEPTAVAASFLHKSMNQSKSERQVIILDCCFSGAIAKGLTVKDDGAVNLQEQLGGKGRAILTSSSSTQYSFEQEGSELSIYTRYLVEGIDKGAADLDGDGWISADELHEYANSKVTEAAPAMTPEFYPMKEGYKILLAKSPKDDPKLKYRKQLEEIAHEDEGEISIVNRFYLDELRTTLDISAEEAFVIQLEVLDPYQKRKEKLQRYEEALSELVQNQYPINEKERKKLERLQLLLQLREEDIASIEERVLAPKKAEYERKRQEAEKQQQKVEKPQQEPEKPKLQQTANFSATLKSEEKVQKQTFEFETATIAIMRNPRWFGLGEKVTHEIKRSRKQAEFFTEHLGNGVILEMVAIPGGTFVMGSPTDESERRDRESPQHSVTIKPFFMGKFQVTQAQWQTVAGFPEVEIDLDPDPSKFKGANRPVEQVSWYEVVEFCDRLSQKTGRNYRLPSEAEWEYACRAGTTTPFHFGETITTDLANYNGDYVYASGSKGIYRQQTTEVGSFPANAFGLYDMHGNVWEWCADHWQENYRKNYRKAPNDGSAWLSRDEGARRLLRGGSWYFNPDYCRSACRSNNLADYDYYVIGFRIVCSAEWT